MSQLERNRSPPAPGPFHSAHDGAALHGDADDLCVAGVAQVQQAEVRTDAAGVAREAKVP